jgi:hypothetical protein
MSPSPPCRLALIFAQEAPVVVVLRRGPTRWVEVIKWNTQEDVFEHGQWLHGRIYEERCGVSPNGRLFVYFALKYGKVATKQGYKQTYTAVSRPPFLTALALWPTGSTWGGGGRFIDNQTLRLAYGKDATYHPGVGPTEIYMAPLPAHHPHHPPTGLRIETNLDRYAPDHNFKDRDMEYPGAEWFGRDHAGRKVFVKEGKLYRLDQEANEILLKDFNADKVRHIEAPQWAKEW